MSYEDIDKDADANEIIVLRSAFDVKDVEGNTPLDYLIDIAFAKGEYSEDEPDEKLQEIIENFSNNIGDEMPMPTPKEELIILNKDTNEGDDREDSDDEITSSEY